MIFARWLLRVPSGAPACEVGAGKSIVAEQLLSHGGSLDQLLITDESPKMLEYSRQFEPAGPVLKVAGADRLPVASGSIQWLAASLGDPYNIPAFWMEAFRVLRPGGIVIFTTPAYDWAGCFRNETQNSDATFTEAEFDLIDGSRVRLPSFIYPEGDQQSLVEKGGLLVQEVTHITIADLRGEVLSPKLCLRRGPTGPVVAGFFIQKPMKLDGPR